MNDDVCFYPFSPDDKKDDGSWAFDLETIPFPSGFSPSMRFVAYLTPGKVGGNHRHPRTEVFLGIGEGLEFVWIDKEGKKQSKKMNTGGKLMLVMVSPFVPRAVANHCEKESAVLLEFADAALESEEKVEVISA